MTLSQGYDINSLNFLLPGTAIGDVNAIDIESKGNLKSLKFDAWVFPFLNLFVAAGHLNSEHTVDASRANITLGGQPIPPQIQRLSFDSEGLAYTGGLTLAYANENWFAALTATYTESSNNNSGGIDSDIEVTTIQPRVGLIRDNWKFFIGGANYDVEEKHSGIIENPFFGALGVPGLPFNSELKQDNDWHYLTGINYSFTTNLDLSFEVGLGDRKTTTLALTRRF